MTMRDRHRNMRCPRCSGYLLRGGYGECINCGWDDDPPANAEAIAQRIEDSLRVGVEAALASPGRDGQRRQRSFVGQQAAMELL